MKSLIPHSIFILLFSLFACVSFQSFAQTNLVPDDQEFQALKALYDSLDGPNWTNKTNWPTPGNWPATATAAQMGTWFGVTAVNGDISKVILSANNLTGKVPAVISQIAQVSQIQLNGNHLNGSLPSSLGSLSKLVWLRFDTNQLTGEIPASLGNLSLVQNLYLSGNALSGSIPSSLGNLSNLRILSLSANQLAGSIPSSLGELSNLTHLYLHGNQLSGSIPESLGNLSQLNTLYLRTNKLTGAIPATLGNLGNLAAIYLNENSLTGEIPESFGNLLNLEYLYVQQNQLTGNIPSTLGALTKLRYIAAHYNQLVGTIPLSFSGLTDLVVLNLSNNKFSGPLTDIFAPLTQLANIDISQNSFTGSFPASIGNCQLLTYLNAINNRFTSLPASLLSLPVATHLFFGGNELISIPDFSNQVNKASLTLYLQQNRLDFSQLEPLVNGGIMAVSSFTQKAINDISAVQLNVGAALMITARPTGQFSTVAWEKQNSSGTWTTLTNDEDSNPQTYTRTTAASTDEGIYRWKMTNTKVTGFTLLSDPITVKTPTRFVLDDLAFQYKYDARKRMTHKKVPGADWIYMVYDDRDRLVMTQDGEQRKSNKWSFTKYDALNRPVLTGIYTHTGFSDQAQMQSDVNTFYNALGTTRSWFESFVGSVAGNLQGYDNRSFPMDQARMELLTVTYYDNYDFMATWGGEFAYAPTQVASRTINGIVYSQPATAFQRLTGQITGTRTRVVGDVLWLKTVNYYDEKYRVIQVVSEHARKGRERTTNLYDFVGKVLATTTSHSESAIVWKDLVNVTVSGNELKKTISTYGNDAGAASTQVLAGGQDGWIEMIYPGTGGTGSEQFFGFSDSNTGVDWTTMDYALMVTANTTAGNVRVYENGVLRVGLGQAKTKGDVLRIERIGTQIYYKVNGVTEYTSTVPSSSQLMADVTILQGSGYTSGTQASFGERIQSVNRSFDYDHAGRLQKTWHSVNDADPVLLAQNEYNELGQLVTRNLHNADPVSTPDANRDFKQQVDYRYNIRGWLTRINNSDVSIKENGPRDYFGVDLFYNEAVPELSGYQPQFNGNISAMKWSANLGLGVSALNIDAPKENAYAFRYDALNRLKAAEFHTKPSTTGWNASTAYHEKDLTYDLNGNIKTLNRTTTAGAAMDQLAYAYSGNQLLKVSDASDKTKGFVDGTNPDNDYGYDANGNMTLDRNKDITAITYNPLNLPEKVTKANGEHIIYTYDAAGRKLRQDVFNATNVLQKSTTYAGEFIYERKREEEPQGFTTLIASNFSAGIDGWTSGGGVSFEGNTDNIGGRNDVLTITTVSTANNQHHFVNHNAVAEPGEKYIIRVDFFIEESNTSFNGFVVTNSSGGTNLLDARNMPKGVWVHYESELVQYDIGNRFNVRACSNNTIIFPSSGEVGYMVNFSIERANPFKDQLLFINHEEGRVVMTDAAPAYQYHLKDHLGNVRLTFTTKEEAETATATMETAGMATEHGQFLNYDEAVKVNASLFDHTNTGTTHYSTRLTGSENERYGLAKSLSVMPGDTIRIEVFAKYIDPDNNNWQQALSDLMTSIATGTAPAGTVVDGGAAGSIGNTTFPYEGVLTKSSGGVPPKAFLNYIMFDRDVNPIFDTTQTNFRQVTELAKENGTNGNHERLSAQIIAKQAGLMYIYLSNDNVELGGLQVEVFFDDFRVEHVKSPVVQVDDYYPFGLTFNSYKRENSVENRIKFQGQEHIDDLDLGWVSFKWRNHMPDIGRFFNIDPLADKYVYNSPYAFSENDVVSAIELEGLEKVRVTNYSKIQSAEIRNNIGTKNNVLNTPVTTSSGRRTKLNQIEKSNNEITRIVTYGSEKGFQDDYMVNRLEENGITVPESVKQGEQTTITEVIDPNAEFSMELNGVSEDKNGNLTIAPLGEVDPSKEESKINMETAKAVGLKVIENVVEWFLTRKSPVEIPPVVLPEEQKDLN